MQAIAGKHSRQIHLQTTSLESQRLGKRKIKKRRPSRSLYGCASPRYFLFFLCGFAWHGFVWRDSWTLSVHLVRGSHGSPSPRERPIEKWRGKSRNVNLFSIRWWTTFDIWTITRYVATHINRCALHIMQWRESTSQGLIHERRLCFQTATRWLSSFIISLFDQSEITLHYL